MSGPTSSDDDRLTELARTGDARAWEKLIARHGRRVLLTLLARGVRASRAEELVQETWARLVAKSRAGELPHLELPGLAITQAIHFSLDEARATTARATRSLDESDTALAVVDPAPGVLDRMVSREALERALAELERCPPKARDVFALVYEHPELPHLEAAEKVGLSVQRLRQTLCEVRSRLRAAMED
jgi:RNA polymerase sigma factor (sigma-70 family)